MFLENEILRLPASPLKELLLSGISEIKQTNLQKSETIGHELVKLTETNITKEYAFAVFFLIWVNKKLGKQDSSLTVNLESSLVEANKTLNDKYIQYLILLRQGDRKFALGHLNEAKDLWISALDILIQLDHKDSYEMCFQYLHIGLAYRDLYGFATSIDYLKKAYAIAIKNDFQYLARKTITELFFCYFYIDNLPEALLAFKILKTYKKDFISDIENLICEAYISLLQGKFKMARKQLIGSYLLCRSHKLSKHRYDLYFHFAYLYARQGNFQKAWSFMRGSNDPVLYLMILDLQTRFEPSNVENLRRYHEVAAKYGILYHIEKASLLFRNINSLKRTFVIDLYTNTVSGGNLSHRFKTDIHGLSLLKLCAEHPDRVWSKEQILRKVYDFNHYTSDLHDIKVYRLIASLKKAFNFEIIKASHAGYLLSPDVRLQVVDQKAQKPESHMIHKFEVLKILEKFKDITLSKLKALSLLRADDLNRTIKTLESDNIVELKHDGNRKIVVSLK